MVNQQKRVQQEIAVVAYSAVVVNDHICIPVHAYIIFSCLYNPFCVKNDIGTGIHMSIHYNCTIGSFLLHSFLLIYHPYPLHFMK